MERNEDERHGRIEMDSLRELIYFNNAFDVI